MRQLSHDSCEVGLLWSGCSRVRSLGGVNACVGFHSLLRISLFVCIPHDLLANTAKHSLPCMGDDARQVVVSRC